MFKILPCLDSAEMAASRKNELDIPRSIALELGTSAVLAAKSGEYIEAGDRRVDWSQQVQRSCAATISIPPNTPLPPHEGIQFPQTQIQITNETTLVAAKRLIDKGSKPLAMNFANGVAPGGGFLHGAKAQEDVLCLYLTLVGDPMYREHSRRYESDSTDWTIYCSITLVKTMDFSPRLSVATHV